MGNSPQIAGAEHVVKWFGYWPNFHDAEVLNISLDRYRGVRVSIYAFERTSDVDPAGYYVRAKQAVVTFVLEGFPVDAEGIVDTRIEYFNQQNVLAHLAVETIPNGFALMLNGIFGVTGQIWGGRISVLIEPWQRDPAIS